MERQAGSRSEISPVNAVRIERENQTERCIDHKHHNLKLDTCARPYTRIGSRQEPYGFGLQSPITIQEFPSKLILLRNPGIADVEIRGHGNNVADKWNAILKVQNTLRVTTHIDDVVKRPRNNVSRFRIHSGNISNDRCYWTHSPEIEAAYIEVAAEEKSFIERHCRIRKA